MRLATVALLGLSIVGCSSGGDTDGSTRPTGATVGSVPVTDPPTTGSVDGTDPPSTASVPTFVDEQGFDDHTVPMVDTVEDLLALSREGVAGQTSMKFTIPEFDRPVDAPDLARAHLMDGNFYGLHDEWYYYRLLNGQAIPGHDVTPVEGEHFESIDEIYRWARARPAADLPVGLSFIDERLYSSEFYDLALHGDPREYGVGSIVRIADPDRAAPEHWLIELEFSDVVTPSIVARFFDRLTPLLPAEVSNRLEWVVRSPQQELVAEQMVAGGLAYADRIVYFRDLVPAGTVGVYNEGVAAGRLLYVGEGGAELGDATDGDIVITEFVPDRLPRASALITSEPQTPLAHVNLLARNRGIPNASQSGITDDAGLRQAARVRAYAIVITRGSELQVALITREQYDRWASSRQPVATAVPPVDIADMPLVVDLGQLVTELSTDGLTESDVDAWRPVIGGKSAGFLTLLSSPGLTPPPDPLAITVRPYIEHVAPLRDLIGGAISDPAFVDSARARWLTLEGDEDYADAFPSDADATFGAEFVDEHPPGTPLGDVLAAGGVRALIEDRPIDAATLDEILEMLSTTYADYDVEAGLRFRSSSSVEDIEGFNGAGLYTSYTGFLQPELLADPDDHDNTVERAILRAWGSYWSFEAFEERTLAEIDHLSGAMGLTVHARFDDELELNNGVVTFTYLPGGDPDDAVVEINVQAGDVDVTNPDPDDIELPEIIRVSAVDGTVAIERLAESTLAKEGAPVLDDAAVTELYEQTAAVANVWRTRLNDSLGAGQQVQTVVLDFEFKTMGAGWPKLVDGSAPLPQRLVLRQVRSLDPGLRLLPDALERLPIPRDLLMRAALVETVRCSVDGAAAVEHVEVLSDPLLAPDMGFAEQPFVVGDRPPDGAACTRAVEYSSSRQALVGLVFNGEAFLIIG